MLLSATIYEAGKTISAIDSKSMGTLVLEKGQFLWAAFVDPSQEEMADIFSRFPTHELALEDVSHGGQISKIENYEDFVFAVFKQIERHEEQLHMGDVYVFAGSNYVISIRKGAGKPLRQVRAHLGKKESLLKNGSGYILYAIMDQIVDRYFPIVSEVQMHLQNLEDEMFDAKVSMVEKEQSIKKLHHTRREIRQLQNIVDPLLDNTHKLFGGQVPEICEGLDPYFRDTHDHLLRISASLDTLSENASSAIATNVALMSIEENKITKKLASWAAIFASVTFLAGIWGMNFEHIPGLSSVWGFPTALVTMGVSAWYLHRRFKQAGWL